jgi:hypothetical protein
MAQSKEYVTGETKVRVARLPLIDTANRSHS